MNADAGRPLDIGSFPLNRSALIEASAGTGKTFTITYLVLRLLLGSQGTDGRSGLGEPLELENILVVTFTEAAASDLKKRISSKLREARLCFEALAAGRELPLEPETPLQELVKEMQQRGQPPALCARILLKAERSIDDASICTIHAFCNSALNQIYAFEAGETFDVRLTGDWREQSEEALKNVMRELFYRREDCSDMLELLAPVDPGKPAGVLKLLKIMDRVRLSSEHEGLLGLGYHIRCRGAQKLWQKLKQQGGSSGGRDRRLLQLLSCCLEEYRACKAGFEPELARQGLKQKFLDCCTGADGAPLREPEALQQQLYTFEPACKSSFLKEVRTELEKLLTWASDSAAPLPQPGTELKATYFMSYRDKWFPYKKLKRPGAVSDFENAACELQQYIRKYHKTVASVQQLFCVLVLMLIQYRTDELLRRDHLMTFDDVLRRLDRLLGRGGRGRDFAGRLRRRYPVALIDEFQDTDPVQFSIFSRLYLNPEAVADQAYCYLIGDPKQSIYAFRNSDLNSYLKAARSIEKLSGGNGSGRYTLGTNHRAYRRTVEAVNFIFERTENPFLLPENAVRFEPVTAAGGKCRFRFKHEAETKDGPGTYITVDERRPAEDKPGVNKNVERCSAAHAAADIRRCLEEGELVFPDGSSCPVRPEDIAVLVRDKNEYQLVEEELKKRGIACVYYSDKSSVLTDDQGNTSPEAQDLIFLMEALQDYSSFSKIARLLLCPLSCTRSRDGEELLKRLGSSGMESESRILSECAGIWEHFGFLSAFSRWLRHPEHGCLRRMLEAGEQRRLVNYYHIAEIIQSKHMTLRSTGAQLRWFCEAVNPLHYQETGRKETLKRLESETRQVKILTIHKSKGLEFPLVFLPFLWGVEKKETARRHDSTLDARPYYDSCAQAGSAGGQPDASAELQFIDSAGEQPGGSADGNPAGSTDVPPAGGADGRPLRSGGGPEGGMVLDLDKTDYEQIERAAREEEVRLTYVALTRSCAANFIYINACHPRSDERRRSLISLLAGPSFKPGPGAFGDLKQLLGQHPELFWVTSCDHDDEALLRRSAEVIVASGPSQLPEAAIDRSFSLSSYSAVVAGLHERMSGNADESAARPEENSTRAPAGREGQRFSFPRGAGPGTFLHALLEHCDFPRGRDRAQVRNFIHYRAPYFDRAGIMGRWKLSGQNPVAAMSEWMYEILNAPLLLPGAEELSLASLHPQDWIPEMDYLVTVQGTGTDTRRINELCLKSAAGVFGDGKGRAPGNLTLNPRRLYGFVTGFLDLVLRFRIGGRYKYFVADYKSNYLGPSFEAYRPEQVRDSVFDPRNRYDVQYLFYTLALHRFLRTRLQDYRYERDFGGVMYLYLRGMSTAHPGCGIFHTLPELRIIEELDEMFSGGAPR